MTKTGRENYSSNAPYQQKKEKDPSLLEVPMVKPDYPPVDNDPWALVEREVKISSSSCSTEENSICVIGPDEPCDGCRTCVRLGF